MPLVLAIEPDPRQAATLKRVVRAGVRAKLIVVDSKDAALAAIASSVPDLILITALLPPRDEDDLTRHLKTLDNAGHLQTLTIPVFASAASDDTGSRMFGSLRRKKRAPILDGCDPKVFGEQIEEYLQRAAELREEQRAQKEAAILSAREVDEVSEPAAVETEQFDTPQFVEPVAPVVEQPPVISDGASMSEEAEWTPEQPPVPQPEPVPASPLVLDAPPSVDQQAPPLYVEQPPLPQPQPIPPPVSVVADAPPVVEQYLQRPPIEQDVPPVVLQEAQPPVVLQEAQPPVVEQEAQRPVFDQEWLRRILTREVRPRPTIVEQEMQPPAAEEGQPPVAEQELQPSVIEQALQPPIVEEDLQRPAVEEESQPRFVEEESQPPFAEAEDIAAFSAPLVEDAVTPVADEQQSPSAPVVERVASALPEPQAPDTDDDGAEWQVVPLEDQAPDVSPDIEAPVGDPAVEQTESAVAAPASGPGSPRVVHTAFAHALGNLHAFVARMSSGLKSRGTTPILDMNGGGPGQETAEEAANAAAAPPREESGSPIAEPAEVQAATVVAPAPAAAVEVEPAREAGKEQHPQPKPEAPAAVEVTPGEPETVEAVAGEDAKKKRRRRRHLRDQRPVADLETALAGVESRWLASAITALRVDIQQLAAVTAANTQQKATESAAQNSTGNGNGHGHLGNGNGNGSGRANGNGSGNGNGHAAVVKQEPAPVQDEWGFYNPERCGMQALMAKLEESDAAANERQAASPPARQNRVVSQPAIEPNWQEYAEPTDGQEPTHTSDGAPSGHGSEPKRLVPLAIWARAGEEAQYRIEDTLPGEVLAATSTSTSAVRLPDEIAGVRYGSGARIRRVRVAPAPKQPTSGKRQVVILSKKMLDDLR